MKKFILPILFLHLVFAVNAATYYFSSSAGNDSRTAAQAKNPSTPWKTFAKLNSYMPNIKPGDSVLFKCGDTFYPTYNAATGGYDNIQITVSGTVNFRIVFSSYGTGAQPVISGLLLATNWTQVSGNIWEAPFSQPTGKERMVIANNQEQPIGRYPNLNAANGGYLNTDSTNGTNSVTCYSLPATPNWTGADVVIRKDRWSLDRLPITAQSGTTLTFTPEAGTDPMGGKNWGFFICNSTNTLDQNGEWFYDASRSKLQMYFSNNNPNSYSVWASGIDTMVYLDTFVSYITFNNLSFTGANQYVIHSRNSSNITIKNCAFNFTGMDAIFAGSAKSQRILNCYFNNTNDDGINFDWACDSSAILNDTLRNTALIAALGHNSGPATRTGINIKGDNTLIQYCEVDSTGYDGIHFDGNNCTVKNCYVNTFGLVVDDGGGIYTAEESSDTTANTKYILNNIVVNGIGFPQGTPYTEGALHGYYLDGSSNHTTLLNNTAANCSATGIFTHGSWVVDIENNTFYNNGSEQYLAQRTARTDIPSGITFKKNISFSKTMSQLATKLSSYNGTNDLPSIGTFDSNYYCRPLDSSYQFETGYQTSAQYLVTDENLSAWRSFIGSDLHSKGTPATISPFKSTNLSGVNLFSAGRFSAMSNIYDVGAFSSTYNIQVGWSPSKLDGGTLQVSSTNYSSNRYLLTMPTNEYAVTGQGYRLSFTVQGATGGSYITAYLRNQNSPNQTIAEQAPLATQINVPVTTGRQDFVFGFIPVNFTGQIAIELEVPYPNDTIWLDNVVLQKATITPTNPDDYIVFQYNPANTTKTFTLSGTYYDAKGATYSGTVTLQPYTSLVLFKQYTAPSSKMAQQSIVLAGGLVNASTGMANENSSVTKLKWDVDNQDYASTYYEVQRSADAQHFSTIGKAILKREGTSVIYEYSDAAPLAGKNYYRIKQYTDKEGVSSVSKMVAVNNISFRVNPNPAKDVLHLYFDQAIHADDHLDKTITIRNEAGATVQTVTLPATESLSKVDINVGGLQKGVYLLSVSSEGTWYSKKFIKE